MSFFGTMIAGGTSGASGSPFRVVASPYRLGSHFASNFSRVSTWSRRWPSMSSRTTLTRPLPSVSLRSPSSGVSAIRSASTAIAS